MYSALIKFVLDQFLYEAPSKCNAQEQRIIDENYYSYKPKERIRQMIEKGQVDSQVIFHYLSQKS